ncbi:MAG: hypothetical protein ACYTG1_07755 [Planctomycetota bacterium]|jgi:hypothetical protein
MGWALVALQAALAVVALHQLVRHVLPGLARLAHAALLLDVWGPVALVLPMMFMAGRVDGSVRGPGWIAVGGPVVCGLVALGGALAVGRSPRPAVRAAVVWTGTGLVLLLLAAAHELTVWAGQCAFAAGAVILWMNTPDAKPAGDASRDDEPSAPYTAMLVVLVCALGQGLAAFAAPADLAAVSGALMVTQAAMAVTAAAVLAGPDAALRLGGWAAALGVIFALGVMSLCTVMPQVVRLFGAEGPVPVQRVAYGFGSYATEALGLALLAAAATGAGVLAGWGRRVAGLATVVAASVLAAWRLAGLA